MAARWQRHDLSDASAACLDGSPAAFYFRPRVAATTNGTNAFVIFFEGGGWCASPLDCVSRTQSPYGSSISFPADGTRNPGNGASYFSDIRSRLGAEFASSNLVHIKYCDGASFSGGGSVLSLRAAYGAVQLGPKRVVSRGESFSISFSGRSIVAAILSKLLADDATFGLRRATDVLLSGCSAGGLAALLNAESIHDRIASAGAPLTRFKVLLFSGIFQAPDRSAYASQMRSLYAFANLSAAVPPSCIGQSPQHAAEPWRCILNLEPLEALPPHIPVFVEQSALDRWHTGCVLGAAQSAYEIVGWCAPLPVSCHSCTHHAPPAASLECWHQLTLSSRSSLHVLSRSMRRDLPLVCPAQLIRRLAALPKVHAAAHAGARARSSRGRTSQSRQEWRPIGPVRRRPASGA